MSARRWGSWPSKAAMWRDRLACPRCGAGPGDPCSTRSGREADYPHSGRELRREASPPRARPEPDILQVLARGRERMWDKLATERQTPTGPRLRLCLLQVPPERNKRARP